MKAIHVIITALLVCGCLGQDDPVESQEFCQPPDMADGKGGCCLDNNQNGVCDLREDFDDRDDRDAPDNDQPGSPPATSTTLETPVLAATTMQGQGTLVSAASTSTSTTLPDGTDNITAISTTSATIPAPPYNRSRGCRTDSLHTLCLTHSGGIVDRNHEPVEDHLFTQSPGEGRCVDLPLKAGDKVVFRMNDARNTAKIYGGDELLKRVENLYTWSNHECHYDGYCDFTCVQVRASDSYQPCARRREFKACIERGGQIQDTGGNYLPLYKDDLGTCARLSASYFDTFTIGMSGHLNTARIYLDGEEKGVVENVYDKATHKCTVSSACSLNPCRLENPVGKERYCARPRTYRVCIQGQADVTGPGGKTVSQGQMSDTPQGACTRVSLKPLEAFTLEFGKRDSTARVYAPDKRSVGVINTFYTGARYDCSITGTCILNCTEQE